MKFIRLANTERREVLVNPEQITYLLSIEGRTRIGFVGADSIVVLESPAEILDAISLPVYKGN